jgi:streptogramin lyase
MMTLGINRPTSPGNHGLSRWFLLFLSVILYLAVPQILKADLLVIAGGDASNAGDVVRFSDAGTFLGTFVPVASGGRAESMAFGPDGNLYVGDPSGAITRYNGSTGAFMDVFVPAATSGITVPASAVFGPDGNLYIGDYLMNNSGVVRRYNGTTGANMGAFTSVFSPAYPGSMVFGPDGNLYVADQANVVKFNGATGAFMSNFVPAGSGGLRGPLAITFGSDGNLYVSSDGTGVMIYNGTTGAFIRQLVPFNGISTGTLAFGPDGNLYVGYNDYIARFNGQTGSLIDIFVPPGDIDVIAGTILFTPGSGVPTQVLPNHGGNSGLVTVQVIGSGFPAGAIVSLTGLGPDITGTNTTVPYSSALSTTFDLTGATPGIRNVKITASDGTSSTLTGGFTVERGGAPQISVNIVGFNEIEPGRPQTYYVTVGNSGNEDSSAGGTVWVGLSSLLTATIQPDQEAASFTNGNTTYVVYGVSGVAAGSSVALPLQITVPGGQQSFQIQTWYSVQ